MTKIDGLINQWRDMGPEKWAESEFGWIDIDKQPVTLANWQRAVLSGWWANREDVTTLGISNIKKSGKTFIDAVLLCWRWLALPGLHFAVANDLDQSTARQFAEIRDMVARNRFLRGNVTVTAKKLTFTPTGAVLEALSGDATGNAGANFLTVSHTEAWGIIYEQDRRNWEELTVPPGRFYGLPALRIADSYAGHLGESETWHNLVDHALAGERLTSVWPIYKNGGVLLFHIEGEEAKTRCFRGTQEEANAYYLDQAATLRPNTYKRLHENVRTTSEGSFIDSDHWASLVDKDHKPLPVGSSVPVYVGLDLATAVRGDDCALIGVYSDAGKVHIAFHKIWSGKRVFKLNLSKTVKPYILQLKEDYNLAGLWFDPYQAQHLTEELQQAGLDCHEVKQTHANRGPKDSLLYELAATRRLVLYDHAELANMAAAAHAKELGNGQIFLTKGGRGKIDLLVALANVADIAERFGKTGGVRRLPNIFYGYHGADIENDFIYYPDGTFEYVPNANKDAHPPGVTWRTCRKRMPGCQACTNELEAEGHFEQQRLNLEQGLRRGAGIPLSQEEAEIDFLQRTGRFYPNRQLEARQHELQEYKRQHVLSFKRWQQKRRLEK